MTYLNEFMALAETFAGWVQGPDGSKAVAAVICVAALCEADTRVCLLATLMLHLAVIVM